MHARGIFRWCCLVHVNLKILSMSRAVYLQGEVTAAANICFWPAVGACRLQVKKEPECTSACWVNVRIECPRWDHLRVKSGGICHACDMATGALQTKCHIRR
jgi:hypothetical protein